ncbi:hypothetical protein AALB39_07380 [Lachnospiraceae bacterium 54-53]
MIRRIKYEEGKKKMAEGIRQLCSVLSCDGGVLVNGSFSLSAMETAKELEGTDPYMDQGIRLGAQAIGEINTATGCGTREGARMMEFLLSVCEKREAAGMNPVSFAGELKHAAIYLSEAVRSRSVSSGNSLTELVRDITKNQETAEMVLRGVREGELVVKESMYSHTKLEIVRGMRMECSLKVGAPGKSGQLSVLVVNRSLSSFMELYPLLQKLGKKGLFILADDIEGEALTLLNANVKQNRLRVWGMKAFGAGRLKDDLLSDAAVFTGTKVFDGRFPFGFEEITPDMLGKAETMTAADRYAVIGGETDSPDIRKRIAEIKTRMEDPKTNYYDQQKLRGRIAGLTGAAPVLYAGGDTKIQSSEEKRRLEYAAAYVQTIEKYGVFRKNDLDGMDGGSEAGKILLEGMKKSISGQEISTWLLLLLLQKISGLMGMWLTTGAVMVSGGYDREDLELMRRGVDIERLRG